MQRTLRILVSSGLVILIGGATIGGTGAFFSDSETSTGNVLEAGAIDLIVGNESYVTDPSGTLAVSTSTSWELDNLSGQLFFDFNDVKPGDFGEDTISFRVIDNRSWLCAAGRITADHDGDYTEPELLDDPTISPLAPQSTDGELAENLEFTFWADDGDNVLETNETSRIFLNGTAAQLAAQPPIALIDSTINRWTLNPGRPTFGNQTYYVGKAWCFGDLTPTPIPQDGATTSNPLLRGTGFTCNGAALDNRAQTDVVEGDLEFYSIQSIHNEQFACALDYVPSWQAP